MGVAPIVNPVARIRPHLGGKRGPQADVLASDHALWKGRRPDRMSILLPGVRQPIERCLMRIDERNPVKIEHDGPACLTRTPLLRQMVFAGGEGGVSVLLGSRSMTNFPAMPPVSSIPVQYV